MRSLTPGGLCAGADKYYPNNFNDFLSGIVTLFELMIVNNWFVIADGITAAYGSEYARAYFIGFWLVAVTVLVNLLVAIVIDAFLEKANRDAEKASEDRRAAEKALHDSFTNSSNNCTIHVGGLEGELEEEARLSALFERFGSVLVATVRYRREPATEESAEKVSWALLTFARADEMLAALAGAETL